MELTTGIESQNQARIQEEAAAQVQEMNLRLMREQAESVAKLQASAEAITDPALGQYLDLRG